MAIYYNEIDPYTCDWIEQAIRDGALPAGEVDRRSILEVKPDDLRGFTQCHFFAGIGGWALAAQWANWPKDLELWTGSPPCQPFSHAGKQEGFNDARDLWPQYFELISSRRPAVVVGEQVAAAVGKGWIDRVRDDMEAENYASRHMVLPACAVDAPHRRDRLWFVGLRGGALDHRLGAGLEGHAGHGAGATGRPLAHRPAAATGGDSPVAHGDASGCGKLAAPRVHGEGQCRLDAAGRGAWDRYEWVLGHDGKARRIPEADSGIRLLADGVSARRPKLSAIGNAIVPQVGAEVLKALL